jgi:hypothetical protein
MIKATGTTSRIKPITASHHPTDGSSTAPRFRCLEPGTVVFRTGRAEGHQQSRPPGRKTRAAPRTRRNAAAWRLNASSGKGTLEAYFSRTSAHHPHREISGGRRRLA